MSTRLVDIYAKNVNNDIRFVPSPVSKMSPVLNYEIDLDDILKLFNFSYLWIYDSQTKNMITIKNLQDYFPEYNPGGGGGGTSDYDQLSNKPSINNVTLTGDKTTQDLGIVENVQADWDETDIASQSYIQNKPTIPADQVNADWNATSGVAQILNKPTIPTPVTVDQTYDATSANAQSGTAVADAISKKPGEITTGKQYDIDGPTVADVGAEVFNNLTDNKASGTYSHAEGHATTASGICSHAEGRSTTTSGICSHAEGHQTTVIGSYSHAEGFGTTVSGDYSHAEGYYTTTTTLYAHAEGCYTKASSWYQHVQGKYNVEDTSRKYAFIIGNGTANNARHNAFAIDWNGLIYVNGATTGVDVAALAATIGDINSVLEEVL